MARRGYSSEFRRRVLDRVEGGRKVSGMDLCWVVRQAGFEPATSCSGGKRSIQLSYWAKVN